MVDQLVSMYAATEGESTDSVEIRCYTEHEACARPIEQQHLRDRRSGEQRSDGDMPYSGGERERRGQRCGEKRLVDPSRPRNYDERVWTV